MWVFKNIVFILNIDNRRISNEVIVLNLDANKNLEKLEINETEKSLLVIFKT